MFCFSYQLLMNTWSKKIGIFYVSDKKRNNSICTADFVINLLMVVYFLENIFCQGHVTKLNEKNKLYNLMNY